MQPLGKMRLLALHETWNETHDIENGKIKVLHQAYCTINSVKKKKTANMYCSNIYTNFYIERKCIG